MGLLDCGHATGRLYGGLGVAVDGLSTMVSAKAADVWRIEFAEKIQTSLRTTSDVEALVGRLNGIVEPSHITIQSAAPEHMGLGSKTTLLLATATAALAARRQALERGKIVALTQRGGASGAGVNLFWEGGMIADGGHRVKPADRTFTPSSARIPDAIPPIISHTAMPSHWKVRLCYDPSFSLVEGSREVNLFRQAMPIADIQCLTALALVYHGILPSVLEHDLQSFGQHLEQMNAVGMKAVEVSHQTEATQRFLKALWAERIAAGLSSFGPCVYSVTEEDSSDLEKTLALATEHGLADLGAYGFKNTGSSISPSADHHG